MDENLKTYIGKVLSESVVEVCDQLGAMKNLLAFSNLDRMSDDLKKNESFSKISMLDANLLLWVKKVDSVIYYSSVFFRYQSMFATRKNCQQRISTI